MAKNAEYLKVQKNAEKPTGRKSKKQQKRSNQAEYLKVEFYWLIDYKELKDQKVENQKVRKYKRPSRGKNKNGW